MRKPCWKALPEEKKRCFYLSKKKTNLWDANDSGNDIFSQGAEALNGQGTTVAWRKHLSETLWNAKYSGAPIVLIFWTVAEARRCTEQVPGCSSSPQYSSRALGRHKILIDTTAETHHRVLKLFYNSENAQSWKKAFCVSLAKEFTIWIVETWLGCRLSSDRTQGVCAGNGLSFLSAYVHCSTVFRFSQ